MSGYLKGVCAVITVSCVKFRLVTPPPSALLRGVKPLFKLSYEDVEHDIARIIHTTAMNSQDQTCISLSYEEIRNECYARVAHVIDRGWMRRSKSRQEFFRILATAINNHVRSLIQRHRFTQKRTGLKPPPKLKRQQILKEEFVTDESLGLPYRQTKPVEISMDDEEVGLQVGASDNGHRNFQDFREELANILTATERVVFFQLAEPNIEALLYAETEAYVGTRDGDGVKVQVKETHLAAGVGMQLSEFEKYRESIRVKVGKFMEKEKTQVGFNVEYAKASALLKEIFGLQVPASIPDEICRRMYSIAARNQYYKVQDKPKVKQALETVGAMVPEASGDKLRCFGILYLNDNRMCNCCGVKLACKTKAANFGLGTLTLSSQLLGNRAIRVPVITPVDPRIALESHRGGNSEDEETVIDFLCETFKRVAFSGEIYFRHHDKLPGDDRKRPFIFSLGKTTVPFELRFINPSDTLKPFLKAVKGQWFLPDNASSKTTVDFIRLHADSTFEIPDVAA